MASTDNTLFLTVSKNDYKSLIDIPAENAAYDKIAFIDDGSGLVTRGQLYITSSYFIKVVNAEDLPSGEEAEDNTIYLVKG